MCSFLPSYGVLLSDLTHVGILSCSPGEVHPFSDSLEPSSDDEVDSLPPSFFADDDKSLGSCDDGFPPPLTGGVVLDQRYAAGVRVLNSVIFKPGSSFIQDISTALKTTQYREEPWRKFGLGPYRRAVSYMQAATKLVKSVKATETQTYTRADDRGFVVNISCSTPDVPFGGNFIIELQVGLSLLPFLYYVLWSWLVLMSLECDLVCVT